MLRLISIIMVFLWSVTAFPVANPQQPKDPLANFRNSIRNPRNPSTKFNDANKQKLPVEITYAKGEKQKGVLYIWTKQVSFRHEKKQVIVKLEQLKSIAFIEWSGYSGKKNSYIFYPSKIIVTLKDNNKYTIDRLAEFNRIFFAEDNKTKYLFTYFYDYWEKGKWYNSGKSEKNYPETNPHPAVVVNIMFL